MICMTKRGAFNEYHPHKETPSQFHLLNPYWFFFVVVVCFGLVFFFQMHWAFRRIFQTILQIMLMTRKVTKTSAFIQTSKVILFYRWLTEAVCLTNHWLHPHNLVHLQQFFKLLERIHWKRKTAVQNWRSFKIPSALLQSSPFVVFHSFCMIATLLSTIGIHC